MITYDEAMDKAKENLDKASEVVQEQHGVQKSSVLVNIANVWLTVALEIRENEKNA